MEERLMTVVLVAMSLVGEPRVADFQHAAPPLLPLLLLQLLSLGMDREVRVLMLCLDFLVLYGSNEKASFVSY